MLAWRLAKRILIFGAILAAFWPSVETICFESRMHCGTIAMMPHFNHEVVLRSSCHVPDVVAQSKLEVPFLLKTVLIQLANQSLRFRPGRRADEGLIRRPALRF